MGQTYYVSLAGADSNTGLTPLNAWKTIQKCAKTLAGGDTCSVLAGNYPERVQINQSGLTYNPITYRAFGSVTMQGFTILANAITIAGFQITPSVDGPKDGWGIYAEGSGVTLDANTITRAFRGGIVLFSLPENQAANTKNLARITHWIATPKLASRYMAMITG